MLNEEINSQNGLFKINSFHLKWYYYFFENIHYDLKFIYLTWMILNVQWIETDNRHVIKQKLLILVYFFGLELQLLLDQFS